MLLAIWMAPRAGAHEAGADPSLTGAPGEGNCTNCHRGTAVNAGPGSVKILLPGALSYSPGVKQRIAVEVSDSAQRRWGFELSARLASNPSTGQAGALAAADANAQVICENGRPAPCTSPSVVQFVTHTLQGTRPGTTGPARFEFDWTPPDTDLGAIRLYAAGNAANGDTRNSGDRIYTTSVELTPASAAPKPAISAERGVVNAANPDAGIAPGSWILIRGTNLASTTRVWSESDIVARQLPAALDNVAVTVNNKPAFVQSVSPTQIAALTPFDDAAGPVEVRVTSGGQTSDAAIVTLQPAAPALFTADGKNLALSAGENAMLDKSARFFASDSAPAAVKPGDLVSLFGTGFGAGDPAIAPGTVPETPAPLAGAITVTVGGAAARVVSAQFAPGFPQIVQLTIQVPDAAPDGSLPVVVTVAGVSSPDAKDANLLNVAR